AREVVALPHWLLAGEGADRFAQGQGLALRDAASRVAIEKHKALLSSLKADTSAGDASPFRRYWNYPVPWEQALQQHGCGTVGAVAWDTGGCFAVATSTGGAAPSLLGRVGDTPIIGCGFYAGEHGAIAVTGVGEYIVPRLLAKSIYDEAIAAQSLLGAIEQAISHFPPGIDLGVIGVSDREIVMRSNRDMPCSALAM